MRLLDKHIVLGVTGGIAAYKAPYLVRALRAEGAEVQVVMSANAHEFVTVTALQAVSGRPVRDDLWDAAAEAAMGHIELARWADAVVVAPATANSIAKLAHGLADDLMSTLCLASSAPLFVVPAMNQQMYLSRVTQNNLAELTGRGVSLIGPDSGEQACGDEGPGRMSEPDAIVETVCDALGTEQLLRGYTVTITAGPTLEAIDPVRYISNHSSGLQGLSIADAAARAGAEVILIAGPRVAATLLPCRRIDVTSAQQMYDAVHAHLPVTDIFIGVAAVADYRPAAPAEQKLKRSGAADATLALALVENPDIIASVAAYDPKPLVIGFAAETNDTLEHARAKRARKGLDAIVLNDVSDPSIGFNSPDNAATLIYDQGEITFPRQSKQQLAELLIRHIPEIFSARLVGTNPETVTK